MSVVVAALLAAGGTDGDAPVPAGPVHVLDNHVVGYVTAFGDVRVDGVARGSVTALDGNVIVTTNGAVLGDVSAPGGRVVLEPGAHVGGEVASSRRPRIPTDAIVGGRVRSDIGPCGVPGEQVTPAGREPLPPPPAAPPDASPAPPPGPVPDLPGGKGGGKGGGKD
jgi:hypothetical protein